MAPHTSAGTTTRSLPIQHDSLVGSILGSACELFTSRTDSSYARVCVAAIGLRRDSHSNDRPRPDERPRKDARPSIFLC
jgi:hypothetical protein